MKRVFKYIDDPRIRKSLIYSVFDGCLYAVMFGFCENYIVPFIFLFDADSFLASFIQGILFLGVFFGQLIGPRLIKLIGQRKLLSIITVRIHGICIFLVILYAYITRSPVLIIFLFFIGTTSTNSGASGWISWLNDLVPVNSRGIYWSKRNRIIGFAQFISIIIAGLLLYIFKKYNMELNGYCILFIIGGAARFSCSFFLAKKYEPPLHENLISNEFRFKIFLQKLFTTNFGKFALFQFLMAFSVNIMAPIVNVHMILSLHFNYLQFMTVTLLFMASSFVFVTYWGPHSDRYGNYIILFITSISLPLFSFIWVFNRNFYTILLIQIFGGFVWSGFTLCTQNYIFDAIPRENIPKIFSYYSILANLSAFLGASLGGILTIFTKKLHFSFFTSNNFELIFILSGLLRIIVILFFIKRFKEVRKAEKAPSLIHFYVYKPTTHIINKFSLILGKKKK